MPSDRSMEQYNMGAVLRLSDLKSRIGLGRSAIYERLNPVSPQYDPTFPRPFPLGVRARGWLLNEVDDWVLAQAAKRGPAPQQVNIATSTKPKPAKPKTRKSVATPVEVGAPLQASGGRL